MRHMRSTEMVIVLAGRNTEEHADVRACWHLGPSRPDLCCGTRGQNCARPLRAIGSRRKVYRKELSAQLVSSAVTEAMSCANALKYVRLAQGSHQLETFVLRDGWGSRG